jgi:GNAT superfamily N-acetyltransferase
VNPIVRPLTAGDLDAADRIMRLAFGTFLGLPDPAAAMGDTDYARTRWRTDPEAAFAVEVDGELAGTNFATVWGSVGFFGPLTIRPDLWDRGLGGLLVRPAVDLMDRRGVTSAGLFTFANSAKHIGLYQKFGFWPRFLTAIVSKPVAPASDVGGRDAGRPWHWFSEAGAGERARVLDECALVTGALHPGFDARIEIGAVAEQGLGETVLVREGGRVAAFAVCHGGRGTEAGSGACYVKVAAVAPGPGDADRFGALVDACEAWAASRGLEKITTGVNTARQEAYAALLGRGFRPARYGLAMQRPNEPGYNRPGVYALDDWR